MCAYMFFYLVDNHTRWWSVLNCIVPKSECDVPLAYLLSACDFSYCRSGYKTFGTEYEGVWFSWGCKNPSTYDSSVGSTSGSWPNSGLVGTSSYSSIPFKIIIIIIGYSRFLSMISYTFIFFLLYPFPA